MAFGNERAIVPKAWFRHEDRHLFLEKIRVELRRREWCTQVLSLLINNSFENEIVRLPPKVREGAY